VPEWFTVPYLVPLVDTIERCSQMESIKNNVFDAFEIIKLSSQFQEIELDVSLFFPTENGKLLSKPIHIGGGIAEQAEADAWKVYRKAQNEVIFDGWESVFPGSDWVTLQNYEHRIRLEFHKGVEGCMYYNIDKVIHGVNLVTIEDLVRITNDNPLDLK
jgi:hypothetical protein